MLAFGSMDVETQLQEAVAMMRENPGVRATLRASLAVVATLFCLALAGVAAAQDAANSVAFIPIPKQLPAKDGIANIPDTGLYYWDTGGPGAPIVLLHPVTGSALVWGYQQPVFAKAGYRVIAYSRRGYFNSAPFEREKRGHDSEDLRHLVDYLKLERFHLLGSAAGGAVASDFAFSYQQRLLSLTISSSTFGVRGGAIGQALAFIRPKIWEQLPIEFRELGPSYRAANPQGVKAWLALEQKALNSVEFRQPLKNKITTERLKELRLPTLVITGVADTTAPPPVARMIAAEIPTSSLAIMSESGHSPYWEQPQEFNRAVLDFLSRTGK
jgi:pimeloyl-ACP methyl ester carboxylesterase